jgi:hypothetical protein
MPELADFLKHALQPIKWHITVNFYPKLKRKKKEAARFLNPFGQPLAY